MNATVIKVRCVDGVYDLTPTDNPCIVTARLTSLLARWPTAIITESKSPSPAWGGWITTILVDLVAENASVVDMWKSRQPDPTDPTEVGAGG